MSDSASNVTNDDIAEFQLHYQRLSAQAAEINGQRGNLVKQAKTKGIDTDAAIAAVKTKKRYTLADATTFLRNLMRSLALVNMPIQQQDMFTGWRPGISPGMEAQGALWDAESAGFAAGRHGVDLADCPHLQGSQHFAVWHSAYQKGAMSRATPVEPATRQRPRRARQSRLPGTEARMRANGEHAGAQA